jgi:formate dehydrogenase subunit delta
VDPKTLVHMANRIGEFFQAMPDREEALQGVATHIRKFWDPRMRRELLAYVDQTQGKGLSELVLSALHAHRSTLSADQVNHADRPTGG